MSNYPYDLIVLGAGAAGSTCAKRVNAAGKRVALLERGMLGGTTLNYGCDPTKTALYSAKILQLAQQSHRLGLRIPEAAEDWWWLQDRIQSVQKKIRGGSEEEARQQMRDSGITLIIGEGRLASAHEVEVNGRLLCADHILIATGAEAPVPDIPGLEENGFLTYKNIFNLPLQPKHLVIIGGGRMGVEFAQLFVRLGTKVHLLEAEAHVLPHDDPDLAAELTANLEAEGVVITTGATVTGVAIAGSGKKLTIRYTNGQETQMVCSELLLAAERRPDLSSLNLEQAGVRIKENHVETDETLRTCVPHIWAAGDVISGYPFTHVAWRQGAHVADCILTQTARPFTPGPIPWVTYTDPELARVGQTEQQLQAADVPYRVLLKPLSEVAHAIHTSQTSGRVKLLVGEDDQILGAHILAGNGGELLAPILLAMGARLPVTVLGQIVWPHPTLSAGLGEIAAQLTPYATEKVI